MTQVKEVKEIIFPFIKICVFEKPVGLTSFDQIPDWAQEFTCAQTGRKHKVYFTFAEGTVPMIDFDRNYIGRLVAVRIAEEVEGLLGIKVKRSTDQPVWRHESDPSPVLSDEDIWVNQLGSRLIHVSGQVIYDRLTNLLNGNIGVDTSGNVTDHTIPVTPLRSLRTSLIVDDTETRDKLIERASNVAGQSPYPWGRQSRNPGFMPAELQNTIMIGGKSYAYKIETQGAYHELDGRDIASMFEPTVLMELVLVAVRDFIIALNTNN